MPASVSRIERLAAARPPWAHLAECTTAIAGILLIAVAIAAKQSWLDRHFLPSFFMPRHWYVAIETGVRILIAASGASVVVARSRITGRLTQSPGIVLRVVLAAMLAFLASEVALRWIHLRPTEWLVAAEEPRRRDDPTLGWTLTPSRVGLTEVGGRTVEYAIDAGGYRVRSLDQPVDPMPPTIVFGGESVMFGEGLTWDESIPAQVSAMTGMQTANLAVHGYSTDQIYLRLARELPHFRQPFAVVSIFMTELFGRNLDDDRPHLAPELVWQPAEPASRLMSLAGLLVPYRRDTTVDQGLRMTHDVLRAIAWLARARGAAPLIVVPQFGPEDTLQRAIRMRVLTDDFPHILVPLDPDWRLQWDRHPNARAARILATAIVRQIRRP